MPYTPPSPEALHAATLALQKNFNTHFQRYLPPPYATLLENCKRLERGYEAAANDKGQQKDPDRLKEIAHIIQIIYGLPDPKSLEESKGHHVLLGALIFRELARKDGYRGTYVGMFKSYWGYDSALRLAINKVLNITDENKLDDLTTAICLEAYRDFLSKSTEVLPDEDKALLTKFIAISERAPIVQEMKYVLAIESLATLLHETDEQVLAGLELFKNALPKLIKEMQENERKNHEERAASERKKTPEAFASQQNARRLTRVDLFALLNKLEEPNPGVMIKLVLETISMLFPSDEEIALTEQDAKDPACCEDFVNKLKSNLVVRSQYTLLGAYLLVLNKKDCDPELVSIIAKAIGGADYLKNQMDEKSSVYAYKGLQRYLLLTGMSELAFKTWGGYERLVRDVDLALGAVEASLAVEYPEEEMRACSM